MKLQFIKLLLTGIVAFSFTACNDWLDESPKSQIQEDDHFNPNRSLETELALFLMTAIRKMWLYIVGS